MSSNTELSGLELRRAACEALGYWWEGGTSVGYWHTAKCPRPSRPGKEGCDFAGHPQVYPIGDKCPELALPAVESNPAVSEPLFLEWCEKNGFTATIAYGKHQASVILYDYDGEHIKACVTGSTTSEARARAIVAARSK